MRRLLALVAGVTATALAGPAATHAATPPDPLAPGPFGVARSEYNAGTLNLTVTTSGYTCTSSATACGSTTAPSIDYGESTHGPGATFPQPLQGSVTWPTGTVPAGGWKVLLFLHGRHSACKTASGADGGSQPWATGVCQYGAWPSWQGYDYLSNLLASWGYVVISPDASSVTTYDNNTYLPVDAGATARAEIIAQTLDRLYAWNQGTGPAGIDDNLVGKLDFSQIGMMGHSRGGEGVTQFIEYNRQRPEPARRYNLQAVFSLAPIDRNKHAPQGTNFAVLAPACDGDVNTISGVNAFERGKYANLADPFNKYLFYVEGANHNFYNSMWASDDRTGSDTACGPNVGSRIRMTRAEQEKTGLATIATFLRVFVGGETALKPWLSGELGLPASACPDYSAPGTTTRAVPCEDLVKFSHVAPAGERQDVIRPGSGQRPTTASPIAADATGGFFRGTGFATFEWCNPDPFANPLSANPPTTQVTSALVPCPGPVVGTNVSASSFNRSYGPQLALAWDGEAKIVADLRGQYRDVSRFRELSLRAAFQFTDVARNGLGNGVSPLSATQDLEVALVDRAGVAKSVKLSDFGRPIETTLGATNATTQPRHIVLQGFDVPLSAFAGVDLTALESLELRFGGAATGKPKGAIQLADVAFQELGGAGASPETSAAEAPVTPAAPTAPLPGDDVLPRVESVVTAAPVAVAAPGVAAPAGSPAAVAPGTCVPKVAFGTLSVARGVTVAGTAKGCAAVKQVKVTIAATTTSGGCRFVGSGGRLGKPVSCGVGFGLSASGTSAWKLRLARKLPAGTYRVTVQALDARGGASVAATRRLKVG